MRAIALVIIVGLLGLCGSISAVGQQPAAPPMPAGAQEVLERMDKDIVIAKTKAITALDKILKDTTKKGDLQGALAIKGVLDKLQAEIKQGARVGGASGFVGRWQGPAWKAECLPDGTIIVDNGTKGRWSESGTNVLVEFENGIRHELERTADGYAGVYKAAGAVSGSPVKYTRISP